MKKSKFDFFLPQELIAQEPTIPRDSARLLCMNKTNGVLSHNVFSNLPKLLQAGDMLVINNSKVLAARLIGQKEDSSTICEILLLRQKFGDTWECLSKPGRKLKPTNKVVFGDGTLVAEIMETLENGNKLVSFKYDTQTIFEKLDQFGKMPLPPYITKQLDNNEEYQTVYAKHLGSAAAPTAGLHFTDELFEALKKKGVLVEELTLHVGLGTFRPVKVDDINDHQMHSEWYSLSGTAANRINEAKRNGGRIIAVGTTSARTLESIAQKQGGICKDEGDTNIFIFPGFKWKILDGLITNFHLPESTLIMLVSAFSGYNNTMSAYETAVKEKYRFFSFGDAMLII